MRIVSLKPQSDYSLVVALDDGREGVFDVNPYLQFEAFGVLHDISQFMAVRNGGYFIEWESGADLSVDTIEAHLKVLKAA